MSKEGDKRKSALERLKVLAGLFVVLSIIIMICAGLGTTYRDKDAFGPPYYIGGFIVGPLAFLAALLLVISLMGSMGKSVEDDQWTELAPRLSCQYALSTLLIPGCFIGCIFTGIWGLNSDEDEENSQTNKNIAIIILTAIICVFVVTIISMGTIRSYGKYFGVIIDKRGRQTVFVSNNTSDNGAGVGRANQSSSGVVVHNNMNIFSTDTNQQHVSQLERENRLLQQQLALQQQMMSQQRQQQQQFTGGMYPPPPPSYSDTDPAYPPTASFPGPSAPPPPYSKGV
ncbi:uncharacterized protein LOC132750921 [Ruditapes philippinarum]|uniref:uncharacterized protein LOC132750921 n=1 Tax=Ruditapes philippinarum TaxID=129788 RepID=UPI00295A8BB4|nr:uncharacterized protein LOC132750921 [Ruditapes philippinarum]